MNPVTPLSTSVVQATTVQRQQSVEKDQELRRSRQMSRNTALAHDQRENEVGSPQEQQGISDDDGSAGGGQYYPHDEHRHPRKQADADSSHPAADHPHLDIRA